MKCFKVLLVLCFLLVNSIFYVSANDEVFVDPFNATPPNKYITYTALSKLPDNMSASFDNSMMGMANSKIPVASASYPINGVDKIRIAIMSLKGSFATLTPNGEYRLGAVNAGISPKFPTYLKQNQVLIFPKENNQSYIMYNDASTAMRMFKPLSANDNTNSLHYGLNIKAENQAASAYLTPVLTQVVLHTVSPIMSYYIEYYDVTVPQNVQNITIELRDVDNIDGKPNNYKFPFALIQAEFSGKKITMGTHSTSSSSSEITESSQSSSSESEDIVQSSSSNTPSSSVTEFPSTPKPPIAAPPPNLEMPIISSSSDKSSSSKSSSSRSSSNKSSSSSKDTYREPIATKAVPDNTPHSTASQLTSPLENFTLSSSQDSYHSLNLGIIAIAKNIDTTLKSDNIDPPLANPLTQLQQPIQNTTVINNYHIGNLFSVWAIAIMSIFIILALKAKTI